MWTALLPPCTWMPSTVIVADELGLLIFHFCRSIGPLSKSSQSSVPAVTQPAAEPSAPARLASATPASLLPPAPALVPPAPAPSVPPVATLPVPPAPPLDDVIVVLPEVPKVVR